MTNHPSYTHHTKGYDIALIRLDSLLTFNKDVMPVRLADAAIDDHATGDKLFAVGWGATAEGGSGSATLKEVELPFVSDTTCANAYAGNVS